MLSKYLGFGLINTFIHWMVFFGAMQSFHSQLVSNLLGFFCATGFSFFVNGRYTFKESLSFVRYVKFVSGISVLAIVFGAMGDLLTYSPVLVLFLTSGSNALLGYLFSKRYVFRKNV